MEIFAFITALFFTCYPTLYVREAQPGGRFPQPDTSDQKPANAITFKEREGIPWPVAVDNLSGDFHQLLYSLRYGLVQGMFFINLKSAEDRFRACFDAVAGVDIHPSRPCLIC